VTSWAASISFRLFLEVSALKSTGAPLLFTFGHDYYRLNHFLPLLTTSYC
jgi:hypothetical protein